MKQKNTHNILIPLMYPADIQIILSQATYFHKVFSSAITLLLVMPKTSLVKRIFHQGSSHELTEKREAFSELTKNISAFYKNNIPNFVTIKVEQGEFISEIRKELKLKKYDLIVLKEYSKVKSLLSQLKAMSEKIISRVNCPVMIVHEKWTKTGINEILIPIDITKKCKDTILWAIAHSKKFGAKINFVAIIKNSINISESLTHKRSILIRNWIKQMDIECNFEIIKSAPTEMAKALLEYADKGNSDLIMILAHEEFIASNNYLGKFANEIIHKSPKPVISMSIHNKPMFKTIDNDFKYGRKSTEILNLKTQEVTGSYYTKNNLSSLISKT